MQEKQSYDDIFAAEGPSLRRLLMEPDFVFGRRGYDEYIRSMYRSLAVQVPLETVGIADDREWTFEGVAELLQRLKGRNLSWQLDVIYEAATAGGWVTRDRVMQISGDENPNLRRFVRPVNAVVSELIAEGIVTADARRPLRSVRKKGRGICYEIPPEFIEFLTPKRSAEMA